VNLISLKSRQGLEQVFAEERRGVRHGPAGYDGRIRLCVDGEPAVLPFQGTEVFF
jgi:hypothetical protein